MKCWIFNEQDDLLITPSSVEGVVFFVLQQEGRCPEEIAVHFVTRERISELHRMFFQDSSATDCISFPLDHQFLGESFICPAVAIERCAQSEEESLHDPWEETTLYLIHSILHLIGYQDDTDENFKKMEQRQFFLLEAARQQHCMLQGSSP